VTNKFYEQTILPRLCFVPYFVARIILFVVSAVYWFTGSRRICVADSHLCIEAGVKGWESIEFKELYQSACEYLPPANVHRLIVQPDQSYLKQIADMLRSEQITHYLYDPRTNNSELLLWRALWQSFRVAILLQKRGVIPIVVLTDLAVRTWRAQAAVVSARRGLVNCFMSPRHVGPIFPHCRLLGPSLMPFSVQTLQKLNGLIARRLKNNPPTALFAGSLYEPRTTKLEQIRAGLAARGFVFNIKGRAMGSARVSDQEYWDRLCYSDIIVTTADQAIEIGRDWNHISHFLYRYLEVLACGVLLVAQDVPSVRRYFTPGIHFVSFDSPAEAIEAISHYLENDEERLLIARQGKERVDALIMARSFWVQIDSVLGYYSIV
jgi:glycosyltransferase involved in cell wall biosynthesis